MVTQADIVSTKSWTVDDANQSVSNIPENCIIVGMNATDPRNNPHNLISLEVEFLFDKIKATILIPILFLVAFPSNCVNMAVFLKQGLRERINLCLFSLALVDLIHVSAVFVFYAERIFTKFTDDERYGPVYKFMLDKRIIVLFGFGYVDLLLVAVVASERCICVLFPLRAQRCIQTKTLAFFIIVSALAVVCLRLVLVFMYQSTCFYDLRTQRVSWRPYVNEYYFKNEAMIRAVNGVFYGFCLTVGCPVVVLIATIVTSVRLTHIVRWRNQTSSSLSSKEIGVTKMLIALSIVNFVTCIPVITMRIAPLFEPRLGAAREYANVFNLLISVIEICSYTNATVNFFVYVLTGTRFRETLRSLSPLNKFKFSKSVSDTTVTNILSTKVMRKTVPINDEY